MKIPTTIIEFKYGLPQFIMEKDYYFKNGRGNLMKFCALHSIKLSEVRKVRHELMDAINYPSTAWEG